MCPLEVQGFRGQCGTGGSRGVPSQETGASSRHGSYSQPGEGPGRTLSRPHALPPPSILPTSSQRGLNKGGHLTDEEIKGQGRDLSRTTQLRWRSWNSSPGHQAPGPVCLAHSTRLPVQAERPEVGKSLPDLGGLGLHCGRSLVGKAGQQALRLTLQVGPEQRGLWAMLASGYAAACGELLGSQAHGWGR